jgi:hypothetical protein
MFFPFLIKRKTFVREKMGGQHNLEKKFLHAANEINRMHQKCQSLFLLGGEEERQLDIFWIFIFPMCSMVSQHV